MDILHKKIRSLTLKQIAYAVATADAGNVSMAARRLNVSQPAISAAIQALEDLFGHRIFTRHPGQGVAPTSFGLTVLAEARNLLAQVESFSSLGDPAAAPRGQVVLCCYRGLGPYVLPGLLKHLESQLPGITVRFLEVDLDEVPSRLQQDNADMAITYNLGLDEGLESHSLYSARPYLLCASDHPLAVRDTVALQDLQGEALILLDQPTSAQHMISLLKGHGVEPRIAARVSEYELQRALVAHGFGISLTYTVPNNGVSYDGRPLVALPIDTPLPSEKVLLVRNIQSRYHPAVAATHAAVLDWAQTERVSPTVPHA
ncbi:MAG: LysR family transcriptional regulator [Alphaproteobacteria bacterium]|nr:LysR family transcriptional regulator [Alphaproteobacteria bacterium]